jgi:fluoride exporter
MFLDILFVFLGGGLGSVSRYGVSRLAARLFGNGFAWGTLAVNLLGCLLIGILGGLFDRQALPLRYKPLFVVGFLGGLTTFSSYAFDTFEFMRLGQWGKALSNIALDNVLGLVLAAAGFVFAARR